MKPLRWVGSALADLRAFPPDNLHLVQLGLEAEDWKSMAGVGPGVCELRIHTGVEHRIFYVAKFEEAVYALHCFEKKSRRTSQRDLEIARARYRTVARERVRGK
jgi:phage-related protein